MSQLVSAAVGHALWRFQPFRVLCIWAVSHGIAVDWVSHSTPHIPCLRQFFLDEGELGVAAEIGRYLRKHGRGDA